MAFVNWFEIGTAHVLFETFFILKVFALSKTPSVKFLKFIVYIFKEFEF